MSNDATDRRAQRSESAPGKEADAPLADESLNAAPSLAESQGVDETAAPARAFEDLTIGEFLALMRRSPAATLRRFRFALRSAQARERDFPIPPPAVSVNLAASDGGSSSRTAMRDAPQWLLQSRYPRLAIYLLALLLALTGSTIARGTAEFTRAEGYDWQVAAPLLWLGFLLWLIGDFSGHWTQVKAYWRRCNRETRLLWYVRTIPIVLVIGSLLLFAQSISAPKESAANTALSALLVLAAGMVALLVINQVFGPWQNRRSGSETARQAESSRQVTILDRPALSPPLRQELSGGRKTLLALASALSFIVWANSGGNRIEPRIMLVWMASIIAWAIVFAPLRWNLFDWGANVVDRWRRLDFRGRRWAIAALVLILILGASFRFDRLDSFPPEMNSDMVVNILDAYKIQRGEEYRIFLANNGGREPLHIYLMAIAASLPGLGFDRTTLNLVSALESFLTLPIMFFFAVEVIGKRRRQQALAVGLLASALLAASFWHVSLARQGLRIPLSPLLTALSALFFARALRHNRRSDFVLAGIFLSFGLYSYKSVRMLPLVYVIGVAITLLLRRYSWRLRWRYLFNLGVLALVAGMVFLPTLRYWIEEPDEFTQRSATRIFGDQPTTDAERLALLRDGVATFLSNTRNALLMFHHTHDNTWISNIPGQPALDPVTGAFLVLGAAAWLGLLVKERDPVYWFVPVLFFVMILLTALAIAFPIEVPSLQRASGAIPPAYLIAALPLAILCRQIHRALPRALGLAAAVGLALAVIVSAYQYNRNLYFGDFMDNYHRSAQNHAEAGQILRGFAESDGSYGNAFIISSPHWWDHRAVGVEAGAMRWDNSIVDVERLPQYISNGLWRNDEFRLQAERDLLFFFNPRNDAAPPLLRQWFPAGRQVEIRQEPAQKTFFIYRVPALGEDGLQDFLAANS